jgi:DNA adenine methylase
MKPMLKWPGGKRRLLPELKKRLPEDYKDRLYIEPFFGGGAFFFHLELSGAIILDTNVELMRTYAYVRSQAPSLIQCLKKNYLNKNNAKSYYEIRARFNSRTSFGLEEAAQFIYLNKTCFNGLFRVNRSGKFNTPFGSYPSPAVCEPGVILGAQNALRSARLYSGDFSALVGLCEGDEFVYLDPPYHTEGSNFVDYGPVKFDAEAHRRLANVVRTLDERGCAMLVSNADTPYVRELYRGYRVETVQGPRSIAAAGDRRQPAQELLIRNY